MQGFVTANPGEFPVMPWMRIGNEAGIVCAGHATSSVNIYHDGEPATIFANPEGIELRLHSQHETSGTIVLTAETTYRCRLRGVNSLQPDHVEAVIYFERQSFSCLMLPLFASTIQCCTWAARNACLVMPIWS
jgi:hypothetical protein